MYRANPLDPCNKENWYTFTFEGFQPTEYCIFIMQIYHNDQRKICKGINLKAYVPLQDTYMCI